MKINRIIKAIILVALLISPLKSAFAQAYINISESGNTLNISVSGSTYGQSVDLVYTLPGSTLQTVISNIGQTYSGSWSGNLNLNEYGIVQGSQVFARAGGQQSNTITIGGYLGGCTYNCGSPYGLSLSQTSVNLSIGQSQTITAYGSNNALNIISNSNSNVASASVISGNQIRIYGLSSGSTTVQVCANIYGYAYNYNNNSCANIYITVSGSVLGANTNLWFTPSSANMSVGQQLAVAINSNVNYSSSFTYPVNAYYISSNGNPSVVSASISSTVLNITALQSGSSNITVCHTGLSFCSTFYVSVYGQGGGYGNISFSQTNPNLNLNQSLTLSIYGGINNNNYYISSNSNPNAITASVSGSNVYLYGRYYGSSTITICQSGYSNCGSIFATVSGGGYGGGNLYLSQTSLNLSPYQSGAVSIYGNGNYYISSNSNSNVASASISGNLLTVYAYTTGITSISVCQNNNSQCASLSVSVGNSYGYGSDLLIQNTNLPAMVIGQYYNYQFTASGGIPPYNFSIDSGGLPAGLNLSNTGLLYGIPQYAIPVSFGIKVVDNTGRSGRQFVAIGNTSQNNYSQAVLGVSQYRNGQLLKEGSAIYIVYKGSKSGFADMHTFSGFGFKLSNVLETGLTNLRDSSYVISTFYTSHPWGSWVKNGQTVYFVHESGLIPVPDWNTFIQNGGQGDWIVNANYYDLRLPILSPMTQSDHRLN